MRYRFFSSFLVTRNMPIRAKPVITPAQRAELDALATRIDAATTAGELETVDELIRRHAALTDRLERAAPKGDPDLSLPASAPVQTTQPRPAPAPKPRAAHVALAGHLPAIWGDAMRGFPNPLVRAGLFTIRRTTRRQQMNDTAIVSVGDVSIFYSGEELRIRDEDVMMQVYHFQRGCALGTPFVVSASDFLSAMQWGDSAKAHLDLYASLRRLAKGHLTISRTGAASGELILSGRPLILLDMIVRGRGSPSELTITVPEHTEALWKAMGYTLISWTQRLSLESTLARWLHSYYSSHKQPYPLKVETLYTLSNSTAATLSRFRQTLRNALDELRAIGFLETSWVDSKDLVTVRRAERPMLPSPD